MRNKQLSRETALNFVEALSFEDKLWLRDRLDSLLRSESKENLKQALNTSWSSNQEFSQEEIDADVLEAIKEYRAEKRIADRD